MAFRIIAASVVAAPLFWYVMRFGKSRTGSGARIVKDEEYEGYLDPKDEEMVDEIAQTDGKMRQASFDEYMDVLIDACGAVEDLYFNVPLVKEIKEGEFVSEIGYRERVYSYELYHQQRKLLEDRGLYKSDLLLNAETDKSGTFYTRYVGARKPDMVLHRPGQGIANIAVIEIKAFSANLDLIADDFGKLKDFLNPKKMNYFGAVALIFGEKADRHDISGIEEKLSKSFKNYWPPRFKAIWHRVPLTRPLLWDAESGEFQPIPYR